MAEETVGEVFETFSESQKNALYAAIGMLQTMSDKKLEVASFLFTKAVEDEARKRVRYGYKHRPS